MLLQGWPKALLLKNMTPVGVTKLPFQRLGQKWNLGFWPWAAEYCIQFLLLISMFKAAPNTFCETIPYVFSTERYFLIFILNVLFLSSSL